MMVQSFKRGLNRKKIVVSNRKKIKMGLSKVKRDCQIAKGKFHTHTKKIPKEQRLVLYPPLQAAKADSKKLQNKLISEFFVGV